MENDKKWLIYRHKNILNNKSYIGITCQEPNKRWKNGSGYQESPKFYNAIQKYGWDKFDHEILVDNLNFEQACELEQYFIKYYNSIKNGYNILEGGQGSLGRECSEETKRKIGKANSGENNWLHGKNCPQYLREKISASNKGKIFTAEHKNKLSSSHKGKHEFGNNIKAKKVHIDNIIFSCAEECAKALDISGSVVRGWLNKSRKPPIFLSSYEIGYCGEDNIQVFSNQQPRGEIKNKKESILNTIEKLRKEVENGDR